MMLEARHNQAIRDEIAERLRGYFSRETFEAPARLRQLADLLDEHPRQAPEIPNTKNSKTRKARTSASSSIVPGPLPPPRGAVPARSLSAWVRNLTGRRAG